MFVIPSVMAICDGLHARPVSTSSPLLPCSLRHFLSLLFFKWVRSGRTAENRKCIQMIFHMTMNEKLHDLLAKLRLKGMAAVIDREIQRVEKEGTPVSEVICRS
ncbi:MAG: hypothetical protein A4E57_04286 [Syntrophorhabdaceae bacterium PtaU1.Bin034]|nr:MAG: hypothetical protein A4E57_04286 [Syntrophorhabdaceae bacterium PtaU1.Bin034]